MFFNILNTLFAAVQPISNLGDKSLHPLVDSVQYGWNVAFMFGAASLIFIIATAIFFLPRYFYSERLKPFRIFLTWTGVFLGLEAIGRFNYTMLLLNIDQRLPFLYPLLGAIHGIELLAGFVTLVIFISIYGKATYLNEIEKHREIAEKQFEAIFKSSNDAIVVTDKNSQIIIANDKCKEMFGFEISEMINNSLDMLRPSGEHRALIDDMKEYLQTEDSSVIGKIVDINALRKDKTEFPVEISVGKYTIETNTYFIFTFHDLTLRKQLEEKVETEQLKSDTLVKMRFANHDRSAYIILNPRNLEIIAASDPFCKLTFKTPNELVGYNILKCFPQKPNDVKIKSHQSFITSIRKVKRTLEQDTMKITRHPLLNKKGKWVEKYWSSVNIPILDKNRKLVFIVHKVLDITPAVAIYKTNLKNNAKNIKSKRVNKPITKRN